MNKNIQSWLDLHKENVFVLLMYWFENVKNFIRSLF